MSNSQFERLEFQPSFRDDCIDRALRGLATPDEIEAELKAKGSPPLAQSPDPAQFDPMAEVWWTLAMMLAWVIWRTPDDVREVWNEYRKGVSYWSPCKYRVPATPGVTGLLAQWEIIEGHELKAWSESSYSAVFLLETYRIAQGRQPVVRAEDAQKEIWRQLQKGELIVEARRDHGERSPIRKAEWVDLYINFAWPDNAVGMRDEGLPRYFACRVEVARMVALWPANGAPGLEPSKPDQFSIRVAIAGAIGEIWRTGIPAGLANKKRDAKINEYLKARGLGFVSSRTIHRALGGQ